MIQSREKEDPLKDDKPPRYRDNPSQESKNNLQKKYSNNNCLIHPNAPHLTRKSKAFLAKTIQERGKAVNEANACKLCFTHSHNGKPFPFKEKWGLCNVQGCSEHHSRLIHGYGIQGISMHTFKYEILLIQISCELITVGGRVEIQNTVLYEITLLDRNGDKHMIKAYQIDEICGEIKGIKVEDMIHPFPSVKPADVARQDCDVELLPYIQNKLIVMKG